MKEFPSCLGESGVQIARPSYPSTSIKPFPHENLVTCVYHYSSRYFSGFITITWMKYLMAQGLSIGIESSTNEPLCKFDIKPWLFSKKKGDRILMTSSIKVTIHWDLSSAKFGSSPEPLEGYYLKIILNEELCVRLGDSPNMSYKKTDPSPPVPKANYVAKREHLFGKRLYTSKAQFCEKGKKHEIRVEYDPSDSVGKCLVIYIDRMAVLQVRQLMWKFRGNESILVDGISIEVYWDVYNWVFGGAVCNGVFLFRSNVSPEKVGNKRGPLEPSALSSWAGCDKGKDGMDSQVILNAPAGGLNGAALPLSPSPGALPSWSLLGGARVSHRAQQAPDGAGTDLAARTLRIYDAKVRCFDLVHGLYEPFLNQHGP